MPSSRRRFLASALAVAAGCTARPPDAGDSPGTATTPGVTATTTGPADTTSRSTSTDDTTETPPDAPAFARWSHATPHDALGTLTLAPGADGPAVYAGSAPGTASDVGDGDATGDRSARTETGDEPPHSLLALSLQDGSQQWRASLPDPVQFDPLHGGTGGVPRLYVAIGRESLHGDGSRLHALDPARGERAWTFDTEDRRFLLPLAATADGVIVGRRDDQLGPVGEFVYGLDAAEGGERWRVESGDARQDGSVVRRGTALLRTNRNLVAVDPASGEVRWRFRTDRSFEGPAYDHRGERVFVARGGDVVALDRRDGSELWRREFAFTVSRVTTPEFAASTTVLVGDYDGRLLALSPLDGGTRWTYEVDAEQFHPQVARTSETLFLGGAGVHAIDPVSGEKRWSFAPEMDGTLRVHAGTTIFASGGHDDAVRALDPETGEQRWRFAPGTGIAGPVTAGDVAFVGVDGAVHALDGSQAR